MSCIFSAAQNGLAAGNGAKKRDLLCMNGKTVWGELVHIFFIRIGMVCFGKKKIIWRHIKRPAKVLNGVWIWVILVIFPVADGVVCRMNHQGKTLLG